MGPARDPGGAGTVSGGGSRHGPGRGRAGRGATGSRAGPPAATHLDRAGVGPGDRVAVCSPTAWTSPRGGSDSAARRRHRPDQHRPDRQPLLHQLRDPGARLLVAIASSMAVAREVADRVPGPGSPGRTGGRSSRMGRPLPRASDSRCVMSTSGTTGPSKGVLMRRTRIATPSAWAASRAWASPLTVTTCMPLFHANGLFMQLGATIVAGAKQVSAGAQRDRLADRLSGPSSARITNLLGLDDAVRPGPARAGRRPGPRPGGWSVQCPTLPPTNGRGGALRRRRCRVCIRHD